MNCSREVSFRASNASGEESQLPNVWVWKGQKREGGIVLGNFISPRRAETELVLVRSTQNLRDLGLIWPEVVNNVALQHKVEVCLFLLTRSLYFSLDLQ